MSNDLYKYVVLRLSPDALRGEIVNIGLVIFKPDGSPMVKIGPSVAKLRTLDARWTRTRVEELRQSVQEIAASTGSVEDRIQLLGSLGLCAPDRPGFFHSSRSGVSSEIQHLEALYVDTPGLRRQPTRNGLMRELTEYFRHHALLGDSVEDLSQHLVVPHVPIPDHPDLKGDFVYRNGVYRVTQIIDYDVAPAAAHKKVSEVCAKVMAATVATEHWGHDMKRFAVVRIPEENADVAAPHLDLLRHGGFDVFNFTDQQQRTRYHAEAFAV